METFAPELDDHATTEVELGGRPSRWWAAGAVVGVVVLLGAGAVAAGGRSTRAIDTTTTTSSSSTTPSSTSSTSTTRVPRATTTAPDPVQSTAVAVADVLDPERTTGTVLYALSSNHDRLWRVDLRTGDALIRRIDGPDGIRGADPGAPLAILPRAGGAVLSQGGSVAIFVPADPDAPIARLTSDTFLSYVMPHADPAKLWRVTDGGSGSRAEPIDMAGNLAGDPVDVRVGYPAGDDGSGRMLVSLADATYAVGPDGGARKVTSSPVMTSGAGRIVALECADDALRCDAVARTVPDGIEVGRAPLPLGVVNGGWSGSLSPSGLALQVFDSQESTVLVHRLDGSGSWEFPYVPGDSWFGGYGWSSSMSWADEQTLCGLVKETTLRCWRDGDDPGRDVVTLKGSFFESMALGGG